MRSVLHRYLVGSAPLPGVRDRADEARRDHGFRDLGLHRIELRVLERNHAAVRCYSNCGFVKEGIERETASLDGAWQNDLIMSILRQEWSATP